MAFPRRISASLGALVLLLWIGAAAAQDAQVPVPQPTFRGRAEGVRVDVYVTRDGTPVTDLRREEIELLEDDAAQRIDSFERFTRASSGSAPRVEPRTLERSRELAADPRTRLFIVFFDRYHVTYAPHDQIRLGLFRALEQRLGPDDLVAFMTPDMQPEDLSFARGVEGLARVEGSWEASVLNPDPERMRDPDERLYETCYPIFAGDPGPALDMIARRREQKTFDALESLVEHLEGIREERSSVLILTDGWRVVTPNPSLLGRQDDPQTLPPPVGGRGRQPVDAISSDGAITLSAAMRAKCEADRHALAALDHTRRVDEIASAASRSNVSLHPVSPAGLRMAGTRPGAAMSRTTYPATT
jgi:hypothetical protein